MKKLIFIAALFSALSIYAKPAKKVKIGIAKIVQHVALDDIERGVIDAIKDAGIDEKEFLAKVDMLADRAFEDQCTTANPRLPLVSELKQIMLDCYYGK